MTRPSRCRPALPRVGAWRWWPAPVATVGAGIAGGGTFVLKSLHAVAREWSRRGPATRLSGAFVEALGARDVDDLIEGLTQGHYDLDADMAPLAFRVAAEGDAVAQELVRWAGAGLADLALGVIR